ncbi:hypothetical protein ASPZODRAFT_1217821 [Penicilliopsis zonata CBS 506.65]|uniref:Uncharacterized protein n=1 Tax=Penicilliopsis zonata CBS 506.65 TaxID=1073090 RepID=A0A1L9S7H8_9EURO|nr:hypothetical protein ASPZODRAFT_1217821 [Penicilliopsis zonata CBS 506.65]OJJ43109.1 hypothetical protein ASPZODRAFT_1217821 [Penicilliopsis zonata CBS 506.65]
MVLSLFFFQSACFSPPHPSFFFSPFSLVLLPQDIFNLFPSPPATTFCVCLPLVPFPLVHNRSMLAKFFFLPCFTMRPSFCRPSSSPWYPPPDTTIRTSERPDSDTFLALLPAVRSRRSRPVGLSVGLAPRWSHYYSFWSFQDYPVGTGQRHCGSA